MKGLRSHSDIIKEVRAWTDDFIPWVHDHRGGGIQHDHSNTSQCTETINNESISSYSDVDQELISICLLVYSTAVFDAFGRRISGEDIAVLVQSKRGAVQRPIQVQRDVSLQKPGSANFGNYPLNQISVKSLQ